MTRPPVARAMSECSSRVDKTPKPATYAAHPNQSCGRYTPVFETVRPQSSGKGQNISTKPKRSTPERIGDAPQLAW